jgi:hypothetical protein
MAWQQQRRNMTKTVRRNKSAVIELQPYISAGSAPRTASRTALQAR